MKSKLVTIALLLFSAAAFSQVVEFKKDIVWIDGKECISMSKEDAVSISFKDMNGTDLMLRRFIHNSSDRSTSKNIFKQTCATQKLRIYLQPESCVSAF